MDMFGELSALGADVDAGLKQLRGNKELYGRLVKKFPATAATLQVKPELENGNYKQAFMNAHSMKGVCGNLFLSSLQEKYSEITEALRDEKDVELAKKLIDPAMELQAKYVAVIEAE